MRSVPLPVQRPLGSERLDPDQSIDRIHRTVHSLAIGDSKEGTEIVSLQIKHQIFVRQAFVLFVQAMIFLLVVLPPH